MVSATTEKTPDVTVSLADAIAAITAQNAAIMSAFATTTLDIDGVSYTMFTAVDGGTDRLVGGKSKGNSVVEKDEHKLVRALASEKGMRWVILRPDEPELDDNGIVKVKRPEGAINRAYGDLAGIGAVKGIRTAKGKMVTAESQAVPQAVKKGMPAQPKKEALAEALAKAGPESDAVVALYNDHQRVKAELLCVITKWY